MVEIKTHMDHYLFTTGLKQRPVRKVVNHVPQGLFYSVTEISNNQVSSYIYQVPMPEKSGQDNCWLSPTPSYVQVLN